MTDIQPPEPPPGNSQPVQYESFPPNPGDKLNWAAITGFVLGCINVISWCIPLCGCPVGIAGIIFSAVGLKSNKKTFAMAGLIMSIVSMLLTIGNGILGIWMQQNGKGIWAR